MSKTILIVGGTGHQGKPVAKQLYMDGFTVRIFTRDANRAKEKMGDAFTYYQGDVRDVQSLVEASRDCQGMHINLNSTTRGELRKIEYAGTLNCVKAAKENGLERITFISGSGVKRENLWARPVRYKWKCEEALRNSGIPYTIFAPTNFMNGLPAFIQGDRAMIIGKHKRKIHWLNVNDYAQLVSKAWSTQDAVNKKFLIYGPQSHSLEEALTIYCNKMCPNVTMYNTSLRNFRIMAMISFDRNLRYVSTIMESISRIDDSGNMAETELILGKPSVGLEQWVPSL